MTDNNDVTISGDNAMVGGWLLFLCVALVILVPLAAFIYFIPSEPNYLDKAAILATVSIAVLAGIFLFTRKPYAVKFAKIYFWMGLIIGISWFFSDYAAAFRSLIVSIIWLTYLDSSKRVKTIYGYLQENEKGYQVWPILAIVYAFILPYMGVVYAIVALRNMHKNKQLRGKILAIISIVISIPLLLIYSMLYFLTSIPSDIDQSCLDFCSQRAGAEQYVVLYDLENVAYDCQCFSSSGELVNSVQFPDLPENSE